ncbi:MAG TPA: polysaccharide biosynthesis tyrosine autokinase [Gemmataceae bacterium]|nr:polysaccharide biosynthesis tyrosine autokinase [Gemmataceae bacterium]
MIPPSDVNNANDAAQALGNVRGALQPQLVVPYPPSGSYSPPALATMPDALSLLRALRRRLVPALTVGLIVASIAGAATWILLPPPKIAARTQLYVAPNPPKILFEDGSHLNNDMFLRTQAYRIRDRFVLNAALRDNPEVAELSLLKEQRDPLEWLEKEINVSFPSPDVMHISISGDRPAEQLKIVSAVTKAYLDYVVNSEHTYRLERQKQLKDVFARYEGRVKRKREDLRALQRQNGAFNEEGMILRQQIALEELIVAKRDLTQVRQQLRRLLVELDLSPDWVEQIWPRYAAILNGLPGPGLPINHAFVALLHDDALVAMATPTAPSHDVEELINKDKVVVEGMQRIQKKQMDMERMLKVMTPEAYRQRIGKERRELADLEKTVEARRQVIRPHLLEQHRQRMRLIGMDKQVQRRESYRSLKMMEKVLDEEVKRLFAESRDINNKAVDMVANKDDLEQEEKVMKAAGDTIIKMEVEQEAPPRITQPDKEAVLFTPDATKRKIMVTGGAAAGALALVLLAFSWFEFQSRKVHSADEVVHGLGLHLVGTVPDFAPRGWLPWSRNGGNAVYAQSMLTESVDAARTQLLHVARQEKLQIVMITSALAGEGKTSLASHLAASLARAGRRTILVDSDLRNPTLHRLFERSRAPGLSELLRGEVTLDAVSRDTPISNLWLISAGKADASALQALAFDALPKLFEQLRTRYDFVIVDSCPVLPVADSLLVGQYVDAVIFSLLRQVSRLPRVYAAYQRLAMLGIRLLGAVVNGADHDLYPADYNYIASEESD